MTRMCLVLIFDLDDTLYDERQYVASGFKAVADFGACRFGWDADASFESLIRILESHGRGKVFDIWLKDGGVRGKAITQAAVRQYRAHEPRIALNEQAKYLLPSIYDRYPLYLVTDGHKEVQARKIKALGISKWFRKMYITHRYGRSRSKPSSYCFNLIRAREHCDWPNLVYVGDNPEKDFVRLNALGAKTIRVLTGVHRHRLAAPGHEARWVLGDLSELPNTLLQIERDLGSNLGSEICGQR